MDGRTEGRREGGWADDLLLDEALGEVAEVVFEESALFLELPLLLLQL